MDAMEKWNYIVEQYKKNYNQSESFIQAEWENYFSELFDYKRILREIDTQRSIHLGSSVRVIPDIILRKDNTDVIDVELKKYNIPFSDTMEEQLKSYLKQLNISVGVIIGKEIRLYWFEYMENRMYAIRIDYTENNPDGAKFVELLTKNAFQKGKIKEFIKSKMEFKMNVFSIQNELKEELLRNLIELYFGEKYTEEEIKAALSGYTVSITKKTEYNRSIGPSTPTNGFKRVDRHPSGTGEDDFPQDLPFIIIKTHNERVDLCQKYFRCSYDEALYHATRHSWRVSLNNVNNYTYVLSVIGQYVQEVYRIKYWKIVGEHDKWEIDDDKAYGRYEFYGEVAPEEIRQKFIGKMIPWEYRKAGMASPVVFSK